MNREIQYGIINLLILPQPKDTTSVCVAGWRDLKAQIVGIVYGWFGKQTQNYENHIDMNISNHQRNSKLPVHFFLLLL